MIGCNNINIAGLLSQHHARQLISIYLQTLPSQPIHFRLIHLLPVVIPLDRLDKVAENIEPFLLKFWLPTLPFPSFLF
jgi:hypothetical protein